MLPSTAYLFFVTNTFPNSNFSFHSCLSLLFHRSNVMGLLYITGQSTETDNYVCSIFLHFSLTHILGCCPVERWMLADIRTEDVRVVVFQPTDCSLYFNPKQISSEKILSTCPTGFISCGNYEENIDFCHSDFVITP